MRKRKGFTLVELLAVIVVLAIISLIATPVVLNIIESAKKGSAEQSAISYVKAIENSVVKDMLKQIEHEDKSDYVYDEIEVDISGAYPTGGIYSLKTGTVTNGVFCINGYEVTYSDNKAKAKGRCTGEELKLNGSVKLSEASGSYIYPEIGTFEVVENLSGGALTCTTSDEEIASCSISGNEVTVTTGTKEGVAILTITSKGTSRYKEASAEYVIITTKEVLSYTAMGYSGTYDGEQHGITVESSGATIKYGETEGVYDKEISPTYTEVGEYTVYYQITRAGYRTVTVKTQLSDVVSLGDYVKMTPTSTSYTISKSLTGYTSNQTINPSELNLWRVIKINSDGTIEMVSEYVSSKVVYFKGKTGYLKIVGALNTIAKQYENSAYTIGSRHMGYNGQTEYITDTSKITIAPSPWKCSTGGSCNPVESQGGGDTLYTTDTNLVKKALGTLSAYKYGTTGATTYWLASRSYAGSSDSCYYEGRILDTSGSIITRYLYKCYLGFDTNDSFSAIRPIVILKSELPAVGSGTSSSPWVLG